jgi:hypothetical protein
MYNPPNPRLSPDGTTLLLAVCQAKILPLGEEKRESARPKSSLWARRNEGSDEGRSRSPRNT